MPIPAKTPLITLMRLEAKHVAALNTILSQAVADLDKQIAKMGDANPITVMQAKAQREAMASMMGRTFDNLEDVTRLGMVEAAKAASGVVSRYENELLKLVLDKGTMANLAKSEAQRAAAGMEAALKRMQGTSYVPLSKQVYKTRKLADGWVDDLINKALASGWSRQRLASELRQSINPKTPGGVSYAANRTARTEINNAFHASSAERYMNSVIVEEVDWHLSSSHPEGDICDTLQDESPYPKKEVPKKPHPNCYCFITPALPDEDEFIDKLLSGKYDPEDAPWTREVVREKVDNSYQKSELQLGQESLDTLGKLQTEHTERYFAYTRSWKGSQEALYEDATYKSLNAYRIKLRDITNAKSAAVAAEKAAAKKATAAAKRAATAAKKAAAASQEKLKKLPTMPKPRSMRDAYAGGATNPKGWRRNAKGTPEYDYNINCTRVSATMEMRMRGYNVTAQKAGVTADKSDQAIQNNWIDRKTKRSRPLKRVGSADELEAALLKAPEGSRFFVVGSWKRGGAHIWNAEIKGGKVIYHEGQSNGNFHMSGTEALTKYYNDNLMWDATYGNRVRYLRVDDMDPVDSLVGNDWVVPA